MRPGFPLHCGMNAGTHVCCIDPYTQGSVAFEGELYLGSPIYFNCANRTSKHAFTPCCEDAGMRCGHTPEGLATCCDKAAAKWPCTRHTSSTCCKGFVCDEKGSQRCVPCIGKGKKVNSSYREGGCCAGLVVQHGKCVPCVPSGGTCSSQKDCCNSAKQFNLCSPTRDESRKECTTVDLDGFDGVPVDFAALSIDSSG